MTTFDDALKNAVTRAMRTDEEKEAEFRELAAQREAKAERLKVATTAVEVIENWGCPINGYDVERIGKRVAPFLAARLAAVPEGPERELLADMTALLSLLLGVAADGSRRAQEVAMSIPSVRVEYPR